MSDRKNYGTVLFIFSVTLALAFLSNIPLLYGYLKQPSHLKFMGIIAGVRDANYYFMMMMQVDGWWPVLRNYFAPGESSEIYHGIFWFSLGKAGRFLGISNLAVYHGARITAIVLFVPAAYYLVSRFLRSMAERVAALLMLSFGAGVGWILMIGYYRTGTLPFVPADVGTPEASSFFTLMTFPHLSIALILIALCFGFVEASISGQRLRLAAAAGVCGLALGFIHAVNLIVIYVALAGFALVSLIFLKESRPTRSTIVFGAVSVWSIAYYAYLMLTKPQLLPQVPVRSPMPVAYLVGFAPFAILGMLHIASLIKNRYLPRGDLFLICWAVANSLMLYSYPLLSQEGRTVLGLQIPLVVLSSRGIFSTVLPLLGLDWQRSEKPSKKSLGMLAVALIVVFTFPSTFCNIFERVSRLRQHPKTFSLTSDEYDALRFLRDTPDEGVVLSGDWIGSYVPRLSHKYSWLGQYDLPSHDSRLSSAKSFFSEETPPHARQKFLAQNNIRFVYYGSYERTFGAFKPGEAAYLKCIFQRGSVAIYRFELQASSDKETHSL